MKQKKPNIFDLAILLIFILLAFWLGYSFWQAYQPQPQQLQGQIEARQYSISSKVPGRIKEVYVMKGEKVQKGQPVFSLHSPELEAKIRQAKAQQQAAGALAREAETGARRQQIAAACDTWKTARAATTLAHKTYRRIKNLYKDGVIAEQKHDEAYTKWQAAKYAEQAAFQVYEMTKEGTRTETKRAAREKEKMAAGAVAEIEAIASDLQIESWYNGEVSEVLLHPGELAPQGFPVVTVVDMNDSWVVLHIREDKLSKWKMGFEFEGKIPALNGEKIRFKVSNIAVMGDYATWRATDTKKEFDMRTFAIEARPLKPLQEKGLRVGMSVLVP